MSTMVLNGFGMFGDDVYTSTDLNRRSGEVLNHASMRPVTISRNNELFALLRREQAARLVKAVTRMNCALSLLSEVNSTLSGHAASEGYTWLSVYEKDDLHLLFNALLSSMRLASTAQTDWDDVDALIHQWRESALLAQSGVLDHAMYSEPSNEMKLPAPEEATMPAEEQAECQPV